VIVEFSFFSKRYQGGGCEHLANRTVAKKHVRCNRRPGLDARYSEPLCENDAVSTDDDYCRARSESLFEFFERDFFEIGEVKLSLLGKG
jgi:hypothetical protein